MDVWRKKYPLCIYIRDYASVRTRLPDHENKLSSVFFALLLTEITNRTAFLTEIGEEEWNHLILGWNVLSQLKIRNRVLGYWQLPICTPDYLLISSKTKNFNEKKQSVLNGNTVTEKFLLEDFFNQIFEWCLGKQSWRILENKDLSSQVRTDRHFTISSSLSSLSLFYFLVLLFSLSPSFLSLFPILLSLT